MLLRCATTTVKTSEVGKLGLQSVLDHWSYTLHNNLLGKQVVLTFENMQVDRSLFELCRLARVLPGVGRLRVEDGQRRHRRPLRDVLRLRRLHPSVLENKHQGSCFEAQNKVKIKGRGRRRGDTYLLLTQQPGVRFPVFPKFFSKEILLMLFWFINGAG